MKMQSFLVALLLTVFASCLAQSPDVSQPAPQPAQKAAPQPPEVSDQLVDDLLESTPVQPQAVIRGFTSYTSFQGSYDSSSGWSNVVSSSVQYDFNKHFGVSLGIPFYISHNGLPSNAVTSGTKVAPLTTQYGSLGDAVVSLNFSVGGPLGYKAAIAGTAPTGDTSTGISTGRPTFDLNNHMERSVGFLTPFVEFGFGDSSALVNRRVRRPYTTLGPLSHFKAGAGLDFLKYFNLSVSGYESLPIGDQKVYSHEFVRSKNGTIIRVGADGKKHRYALVAVATGQGLLEDNGVTTELGVSVGRHVDLSAAYNRSVRQSLDTVEFGIGYRFGKSTRPPAQ